MQRTRSRKARYRARVFWGLGRWPVFWGLGRWPAAIVLVGLVVNGAPPTRDAARGVESRALQFVAGIASGTRPLPSLAESTVVLADDGTPIAYFDTGQRRRITDLGEVPPLVQSAILAAEDRDFYHHAGSDPVAIARAAVSDLTGQSMQGASTIAEQLAKLNFTGNQRTLQRRLGQVREAAVLTREYSPQALFQRYLNQVYFGRGAYGIVAAAETFFRRAPAELTAAQAAALAGLIQAPDELDPWRAPDAAQARRDHVLALMLGAGSLTKKAYEAAVALPLGMAGEPGDESAALLAPAFAAFVRQEALRLPVLGPNPEARAQALDSDAYTIRSTLDVGAYLAAQEATQRILPDRGQPASAVVSVQPGDGAIRVLNNGMDPTRSFDLATESSRQPGAAYNPLLDLGAARAGLCSGPKADPSVCAPAAPSQVAQGLLKALGPDAVRQLGEELGVDRKASGAAACATTPEGMPAGVSPLGLAAADATIAGNGVYAQPYAIAGISNRAGGEVYRHRPVTRQVADPFAATAAAAALRQASAPGSSPAPDLSGSAVTDDLADAWAVGSTAGRTTVVWVGDPDRESRLVHLDQDPSVAGRILAAMDANASETTLAAATSPAPPDPSGQPALATGGGPSPVTIDSAANLGALDSVASETLPLAQQINAALASSTALDVGVAVDIGGQRAVDINGSQPLPPGSNQKLFTTGAALLALGPDHAFSTRVVRDGPLGPGGSVRGTLVLLAGGDPTLTSDDVASLAKSVRDAGITSADGLVLEDSHFDAQRSAPGWSPTEVPDVIGPLSALSVDENHGRCDAAYQADPALINAEAFRQALADAGVATAEPVVRGAASAGAVAVASHRSAPLSSIVHQTLTNSDAFAAEMLLKELGASAGQPTTAGGASLVSRQLHQWAIGSKATFADGSGLSALDYETPDDEVAWLKLMRATAVGQDFAASLPVACVSGTLQQRLCESQSAGRVQAKTGTLTGTVALSGYTTTQAGDPVTFSVLLGRVSDITAARRAVDDVALLLRTSGPTIVAAARSQVGSAPASAPVPRANPPTPGPVDAGRFAPGSCIAYPSTSGDRHQTVFLDAGHGGPDPGALGIPQVGHVLSEAVVTLPTVLDTVPLLQGLGYHVVVSRTGDASVAKAGPADLRHGFYTPSGILNDDLARAGCADLAHASVLISVHFDAASSPASGMVSLYDAARPFSEQSRRFASLLQADVLFTMDGKGWSIPDLGARSDREAGAGGPDAASRAYGRNPLLGPASPGFVDTPSAMPGVLIEPLFITDPVEASIAASPEGQAAIAHGIAQAVDTFLGAAG